MAKIVCEQCGSSFPLDRAKGMKNCPVCGKPLWGDDENISGGDEQPNWITWYYYGFKDDGGKTASLRDKPIDLDEYGDIYFLIKEFKAPPRDSTGSSEKAKEILRTYVPDAFAEPPKTESIICCPYCFSREFTLLNRGYSIFTGFLGSGKVKRVCNRCKREF